VSVAIDVSDEDRLVSVLEDIMRDDRSWGPDPARHQKRAWLLDHSNFFTLLHPTRAPVQGGGAGDSPTQTPARMECDSNRAGLLRLGRSVRSGRGPTSPTAQPMAEMNDQRGVQTTVSSLVNQHIMALRVPHNW
jgi:hypothetical protein